MPSSNPFTLVFIPGSWHQPICYSKILELAAQRQLQCVSVNLPSTQDNPAVTFEDDFKAARGTITTELDKGRDVIVVAHSYGGLVGNSAIKGLTKSRPARDSPASSLPATLGETTSAKAHVIGLILIASGFSLTGLAFMDPFFGRPPPYWRVNKDTGYAELLASPYKLFYHDVPVPEADYWVSQLTTQSLKALFEGGEFVYAGWRDVPVWYIGTIEDKGLPVVVQRMQIGMARQMGGVVEHRELRTSHSPFLSQPKETMKIMLEAIASFTGEAIQHGTETDAGDDAQMLPVPKLWQPITWYRFGVPLVLGHVIGKILVLFGWDSWGTR